MAEHYCNEHGVKFFKTKNMRGYAHPIEDTGKWCNEEDQESYHDPNPPAGVTMDKVPPPDNEMTKEDWADRNKNTRKSIERQKSLDCAVNWCVAKVQGGQDIKTTELITVASLFESYIENGITVQKKDK